MLTPESGFTSGYEDTEPSQSTSSYSSPGMSVTSRHEPSGNNTKGK